MRSLFVGFALLTSVLFNVFFAAGYFSARAELDRNGSGTGSPTEEVAAVTNELGLTPEQQASFMALRETGAQERRGYREARGLIDRQIGMELAKEQPDAAVINDLRTKKAELRKSHDEASQRLLAEFIESLSAEQRRTVGDLMRRCDSPPGPGQRSRRRGDTLKRFDGDGDGRLDDAELAKAKASFDEMQNERKRQRAEMMKRFDADGDGELDPEEEKALRDHMRTQRMGRHRDGTGNGNGRRRDGNGRRGDGGDGRPHDGHRDRESDSPRPDDG